MIGRIFRWNRVVLPPWWMIACFLPVYLFVEGLCLYVGWWLNMPGDVKQFAYFRFGVVGAAAVFYALFRVSFHPAHRPEYRAWLKCTPWTADKPLPLAPVHLIPQDAAIVGLLLLLMGTTDPVLIYPAFAFLFVYQLAIAATLGITGDRWQAYGLLFLLAIAVWLVQASIAGLVVLVLVYPLTCWADQRCLARFPWRTNDGSLLKTWAIQIVESRPAANQPLGFPFQYLAPKQVVTSISLTEGTALSVLAGFWAHAVIVNVPDREGRFGIAHLVCDFPIMFVIGTRCLAYCGNYWPSISFLGRIATGRWIIPRYDRVLVAPLVSVAICIAGLMFYLQGGIGMTWVPTWGMPLLLTLVLWLNLNLGPKLLDWRLTGGHRLGLGIRNRQQFVEP